MTSPIANDTMIEVPKRQFDALSAEVEALRSQLEWFKGQVFGVKSEKRHEVNTEQAVMFAPDTPPVEADAPTTIAVPAHTREKRRTGVALSSSPEAAATLTGMQNLRL